MASDDFDGDPIVKALERSTIAQTLKAARASLAEPSRPFTPLDRSLFQLPDSAGSSRPSSSYTVDQLTFVRDTFGSRPESARSSRSSRASRPETITEEDEGHRRRVDTLRLEEDDEDTVHFLPRRASPQESEVGDAASSGSEELTSVPAAGFPTPPVRMPARPPKPPGSGYPSAGALLLCTRTTGGYPDRTAVTGLYPQRQPTGSPHRRRVADSSGRRKKSFSPAPVNGAGTSVASDSSPPGTPRQDWDRTCKAVIEKLQGFAMSKERRRKGGDLLVQMCERIWDLAIDMQKGKGTRAEHYAPMLLREVMGLMDVKDLKDAKCIFKLSRSALALLQMEGATKGVHTSGVQAAYLNIAQVLFKYSQKEGHDKAFLSERLIEPLLAVLQTKAPESSSNDLRVYIVGILKNISYDDANQQVLAQYGAVAILFSLMGSEHLTGSSKEAQLLIQITATLRNLASHQYKQFLHGYTLNSLTRVMALFPGHVELLTNIARIMSKLTLHNSACEAYAQNDDHIRQLTRTLNANVDSAPLALRLAFVLGNLTERSDRLRVVFAFDCEGTALVPQLLSKYWQKDRRLARIELEKGQARLAGMHEIEEVLVKLVRLLANMAISASAGATLSCSSAVIEPLLDMLGTKRIGECEELVLNVVAAVTNLLFYDVPSNLLFQEDNKQLLCRLFRPLLLESYNVEALIETARALGNLSRHADARLCMAGLRLDEILVILLDHDDRDLVFYVCGALVNLGADPDCTSRLVNTCPMVSKLGKLLGDAPPGDTALQLVAVKVLTNLSLDPSVNWAMFAVEKIRSALEQTISDCESALVVGIEECSHMNSAVAEKKQLLELSQHLLWRLPLQGTLAEGDNERGEVGEDTDWFYCKVAGCGRRFGSEEKLVVHASRRHGSSVGSLEGIV